MKRVLMLAPVPATAAATRFRLQQFIPFLRDDGIDACIRPFLTQAELAVLYGRSSPTRLMRTAASAIGGRLRDLASAASVDLIVVQREAALAGPPVIEWAISHGLQRPMVFDFDDAIWVPYISPTYGRWLPRLLKMPGKTNFNLKAAQGVIAGSQHLADYARALNPRVTVIPTVVDTDQFTPLPHENAVPVLGWIGTHSTAPYLRRILPALARLARTHRFVLRVVGANFVAPGVPLEVVPWTLDNEITNFQTLDIGLYPMDDDAWSRGKSGFKAVQYMACGVPTVASPVGPVLQMVSPGESGFFAATQDEWVQSLALLLDDHRLRRRMAEQGRDVVATNWSLRKFAPLFVSVIRDAMS